ncbi:MAG: MutS2/Smr-associated SH3 domain-containing protein, partial [Bacteroidaceae bacterium]
MIYPIHFEQKIGFSKVRELLKQRCLSQLGIEQVEKMDFTTSYKLLHEDLLRVTEFVHIIQDTDDFPDQYFYDVRPALTRIEVEGLNFDVHEIFDFRRSLQTIHDITRFLDRGIDEIDVPAPRGQGSYAEPQSQVDISQKSAKSEEFSGDYPYLHKLTKDIVTFPNIINRIDQLIDKFGKIRDNASPALAQIRRELIRTTQGISKSLYSILRSAQSQGYVEKDATPTLRDGRLVIPVTPSMKRKLQGIIHDESATGKTIFIEPTQVVEANNRIRELEREEKREIIRLLKHFTDMVRPYISDIFESYIFLGLIDFIRAKAYYSISCGGILPSIEDKHLVDWRGAIHPLLADSLKKQNKKVVPLDIALSKEKRMLIISGPNAGGKSVCLKTVGLLQYMLQCGLLVPMHESSIMGLFEHIFIDIGDEQSIEDDLSTYSSHLTNMKMMLRYCDPASLILIDEFGGGTEPQIGGAIAQSVLGRFLAQGSFGVITTHYQNLKHFADSQEGAVNAAMLYDRHEMRALYELQIGNPGSSFAIEIARKIGLPESVIKEASEMVGNDYISSDKYLQDIVRDKRYWDRKRQEIRVQDKRMSETIERYEKKLEELTQDRKEIIKKAKEDAEGLLNETNARIERTILEIRNSQADKQKTKEARNTINEFKEEIQTAEVRLVDDKIARKMKQLREKQERKKRRKENEANNDNNDITNTENTSEKSLDYTTPNNSKVNRLQEKEIASSKNLSKMIVGSYVKLDGKGTIGEILSINGKQAIVAFGSFKTTVKLNRLVHTMQYPQRQQNASATFVSVQTKDSIR